MHAVPEMLSYVSTPGTGGDEQDAPGPGGRHSVHTGTHTVLTLGSQTGAPACAHGLLSEAQEDVRGHCPTVTGLPPRWSRSVHSPPDSPKCTLSPQTAALRGPSLHCCCRRRVHTVLQCPRDTKFWALLKDTEEGLNTFYWYSVCRLVLFSR